MRACDALVYDRLVSPELVAEAPADALRVPREGRSQEEVSALLVSLGRRGLAVVRLKGGDPLLFGRGGEEALALARAGVPFEIVPGVSSLSAVPASCGIPITHRGLSSQVTAVSGHDPNVLDYEALARTPGTLVLFMAFAHLHEIALRLVEHGRSPAAPAAVIASGTLPEERSVVATLGTIARAAAGLRPPALVVVGDVVSLAGVLAGEGAQGAPAAPRRARSGRPGSPPPLPAIASVPR